MKRGMRPHPWLILWLAFWLAAPGLQGQQIQIFNLTEEREGLFEFLVRHKSDRRSNDLTPVWDAQELEFVERIGWGSSGYFYHPYFLHFRFFALLELQQDRYAGASWDRSRDNKILPQGRFDLALLERHPYSFNFFGDRQESEVDRAFARSFPMLIETLGGSFTFRRGPLPARMLYRHSRRRGFEAGDDIRDQTEELRAESQYKVGGQSRGTLTGEWIDIWEDVQKRRLVRTSFMANNVSWFDPERNRQLTSLFRTTIQESLSDTSTTSLSETFSWRHSPSLASSYRFRLDHNEIEAQVVDTLEGRASLSHQLYESLTSRFELFASDQNRTLGSSRRWGGELAESYAKNLSDWARLGLSLGLTAETLDRERIGESAEVVNEPHLLVGEQPVQLNNLDIERASVTVTDERGARIYFEGEDYLLIVRGAVTEMVRLVLGDIPDGAVVLVSYRFLLQPTSRISTRGGNTEVRLGFGSWISLRSGYTRLVQKQEAGRPGVRLESLDRAYWDMRAAWRWLSGGVALDNRRSRISPQRSLSEYLTVSAASGGGLRWLLSANHQLSHYPDERVEMRSVGIFASLAVPLGFRGRVEGEARWRRDCWRGQPGFNNLDDRGIKLALDWRFADLIFSTGARLARIVRGNQIDNTSRIFVGLRREF